MKNFYFEYLEKFWTECKGSPLWYQFEIFIEKLSVNSQDIFMDFNYKDNLETKNIRYLYRMYPKKLT